VHVPSRFECDFGIASTLGFRTALLRRYGPMPVGRSADQEVADLAGLVESLPSVGRSAGPARRDFRSLRREG
jgi:hypothetical protein